MLTKLKLKQKNGFLIKKCVLSVYVGLSINVYSTFTQVSAYIHLVYSAWQALGTFKLAPAFALAFALLLIYVFVMGIQLLFQIEHPVSFKEPENLALCNNYLGRNMRVIPVYQFHQDSLTNSLQMSICLQTNTVVRGLRVCQMNQHRKLCTKKRTTNNHD